MVDLSTLGNVSMGDEYSGTTIGNILILNKHEKTGKYYARIYDGNGYYITRDYVSELLNGNYGDKVRKLIGNPFLVYDSGKTVLFDINGKTILIDTVDLDKVRHITWRVHKDFRRNKDEEYVYGGTWDRETKKWTNLSMHRFILDITDPEVQVDHRDFDTTNNCRSNIRKATQTENTRHRRTFSNNEEGIRGVRQDKRRGSYQARITIDKNKFILANPLI